MADNVHVPGIKEPLPKWAVFGGVAAVGVLIIMYYRNQSSSSASSSSTPAAGAATTAATASDPYPWDGTYGNPSDPNSMDPATGQTYGDEGSSGYGLGGGYPSGAGGGGAGATGTGGVSGPPFSTNAQWSAYVISQLEANDPSANPADIQNAIGEYLNGQPLTSAYKTFVFDAIAIGGPPPVAGPTGYPPKVMGNGHKGGGGGETLGAPAGLHTAGIAKTGATLAWSAVKGAAHYNVHVQGPGGVNQHMTTAGTNTQKGTGNLRSNETYTWQVQAIDSAGKTGPWSATASFRTKK